MMFFPLNQKGHPTGNRFFRSCFVAEHLRYTITATCSAPHPAKNFAGEKSGLARISHEHCVNWAVFI